MRAGTGLTFRIITHRSEPMSFEAAVNAKAIEIGKLADRDDHRRRKRASLHRAIAGAHGHRADVSPDALGPEKPVESAQADRLVLSEGHAVPIIYAALADLGGIVPLGKDRSAARPMTREDAHALREIESPIDGHPNPRWASPSSTRPPARWARVFRSRRASAAPRAMDGLDATSTASSATANRAKGRSGKPATSSSITRSPTSCRSSTATNSARATGSRHSSRTETHGEEARGVRLYRAHRSTGTIPARSARRFTSCTS